LEAEAGPRLPSRPSTGEWQVFYIFPGRVVEDDEVDFSRSIFRGRRNSKKQTLLFSSSQPTQQHPHDAHAVTAALAASALAGAGFDGSQQARPQEFRHAGSPPLSSPCESGGFREQQAQEPQQQQRCYFSHEQDQLLLEQHRQLQESQHQQLDQNQQQQQELEEQRLLSFASTSSQRSDSLSTPLSLSPEGQREALAAHFARHRSISAEEAADDEEERCGGDC
jgi:hypothetical protein